MRTRITLKPLLMRAAVTLLLALFTATTAGAETVDTYYIDKDGTRKNVTATVLTSITGEQVIPSWEGWYVVNSNIDILNKWGKSISLSGKTYLILADGCTMNLGTAEKPIRDYTNGLQAAIGGGTNLYIYGQSEQTGQLNIFSGGDVTRGIYVNNYRHYGGNVNITANGSSSIGIYSQYDVEICRGSLTVHAGWKGIQISQSYAQTGGNVSIISEDIGLDCGNSPFSITGGSFSATGKNVGISGGGQTLTLGWTNTTDQIFANSYSSSMRIKVADGQSLTDGTNIYSGTIASTDIINGKTLTPDLTNHFSQSGDTYTIHTAMGWDAFCEALQDNDTYNRFSGKTVALGADITVSRMAGSQYHDFCGTFDGNGKTLTFNYGSPDTPANMQYIAPFHYVSTVTPEGGSEVPAAFRNLHVVGDIYTSAKYAAGLIAQHWGTVNVENCRSSIVIHSSVSGDGTHGGFEAESKGGLNITGCVFDGKLLTTGTTATTNCGGFVGFGTLNISNSLYAPAALDEGEAKITSGSATFVRNSSAGSNCYYTRTLGTEQGKAPLSVMAGDGVTVSSIALTGTATEYTVSGITAYSGGGIERGGTLYYGSGDDVSLTLGNTPPTTLHTFYGYTANNGRTLSGSENHYTLTMPDADVTVSTTWTMQPVSYLDAEGKQQTCTDYTAIYNGSNPTTLSTGWYVVTGTVSYDGTVTLGGDVHLILADGCQMNIGSDSDEGRINGKGINGTKNLTIYSESAGSGALSVYTTGAGDKEGICAKALTINGGHVTADADGDGAYALYATDGDITINGGTVSATATSPSTDAILANGDFYYNGGNVTTSATSGNAISARNYYFDWRNTTDRITISATSLYTSSYNTATFTSNMTDGYGNIYTATTPDALAALNDCAAANDGLTLQPCLAIISYDSNGSTSQEWVTYVAETNLAVPVGLTAYTVGSVTGTEAVAEQVSYLPEGVPVLLHRSGTDVNSYPAVAYDGETTAVAGNLLQVANADNQPTAYQDYALYGDEFVLLGTGELTSGVVFLKLPANGNGARSLSINVDETADMYHVPCTMYNSDDAWYDLQGRKIVHSTSSNSTLPKGVYIYKGKKVIIK